MSYELSPGSWKARGVVHAGTNFRSTGCTVDWYCGPCGTALLQDVERVDSWTFFGSGACYLNGDLVHFCPKGYTSQSSVMHVTKHSPYGLPQDAPEPAKKRLSWLKRKA